MRKLVRRKPKCDDEGEVEQQLQRRRNTVGLMRVASAHTTEVVVPWRGGGGAIAHRVMFPWIRSRFCAVAAAKSHATWWREQVHRAGRRIATAATMEGTAKTMARID